MEKSKPYSRALSQFHSLLKNKEIIALIFVSILLVELIKTAWISDDALITIRTVLNFIHGYGPVFNTAERVQAYTHPLWFLLISLFVFITRAPLFTTLSISLLFSLITSWILLAKTSRSYFSAIYCGCILIFSKAFIDFSTSGLENPLANFLLVILGLFSIQILEKENHKYLSVYFFLCSLLYLTRPDLILLIAPLSLFILYKTYRSLRTTLKIIGIAALPVIFWTLFSIFYYGFPFPNTAYAKLGTGISQLELIKQGFRYLLDSFTVDPITLITILCAFIISFKSLISRMMVSGIVLYLIYIVTIGGDFMSGRFFVAPLIIALVVIARTQFSHIQKISFALAIILLVCISAPATLLSGRDYGIPQITTVKSIVDERGFYFQHTGLLNIKGRGGLYNTPVTMEVQEKSVHVLCGGIGLQGLLGGPSLHLIDSCALTDPLLARLPARYDAKWRIGHFRRAFPEGYEESIMTGTNKLTDTLTKDYYEVIRNITRGPLISRSRFVDILRLNMGLIQEPSYDMYRYPKKNLIY